MSLRAALDALARAAARHAWPGEARAALHLPGGPFPPRLLLALDHRDLDEPARPVALHRL